MNSVEAVTLLLEFKSDFVTDDSRDRWGLTPLEEEVDYLTINSRGVTREYLREIKKHNDDFKRNVETQNLYCIGQKKNQKTFKALAADIGQESAKKFLDEHTFPEIKV
jgi:hypothetical protein